VAGEPRDAAAYLTAPFWAQQMQLSEAANVTARRFGLADRLDTLPGGLPYGTRRLVAIARAVAGDPDVLMLDEPAAGLDGPEREELMGLLRWLAEERQVAIVLIEHDVRLVAAVSDRMIALDSGKLVVYGQPEDVVAHPQVVEAYLGETVPSDVAGSEQGSGDQSAAAYKREG